MKEIDISSWKKFRIGDLFDIHTTKHYNLTNIYLFDDNGENPVVVNSSYNNGIGGYTSKEPTENGNMITFSDTTNAEAIFYQENKFVGYPHIQGLYPIGQYKDKWNKTRYLFLMTILKKIALLKEFDYANKFTREIASNLEVYLPVDKNKFIDFEYIDNYMSRINKLSDFNENALYNIKVKKEKIDIRKWKKFHIYDDELFNIDQGTKLDKSKMTQNNPIINFVGRANANNGITTCVDKIEGIEPYPAGYMSLSLGGEYLGSCFIQPSPFYTSQNVVVLKPKWNMSSNIKQFISTAIFKESRTHYKAFADELNRHIKTDFSFYLPVNSDEKIDFEYMEKFMKKIIDNSIKKLNILT